MTTRRGFLSRLLGAAGALLGLPLVPKAASPGCSVGNYRACCCGDWKAGPIRVVAERRHGRSWPIFHTQKELDDLRDVEIPKLYAPTYWTGE